MTTPDQQLQQAASEGNAGGISEALKSGANVNARGEFGDTALNQAAQHGRLDAAKLLVEAGADIENLGGADMTPLMNAATAGHAEVARFLIEKGARVTRDLLSSVQLKVNILEENREAGMVRQEAVEAWQGFLDFLVTDALRQDLPETVNELSAADTDDRRAALRRIEAAANRGLDLSAAAPRLRELTADQDPESRGTASAALSIHYVLTRNLDGIRQLLASQDREVKTGAVPALVSAAQHGLDVSPLLPAIMSLLEEDSLNLRHDAAITVGYAATSGVDVSIAIPRLTVLLKDDQPQARRMAAWALYRIAKRGRDISAAIPSLKILIEDAHEEEDVREMAREAQEMAERDNDSSRPQRDVRSPTNDAAEAPKE